MGGLGSGRRDYATTPTVGRCYHLSAGTFSEATDAPHGSHVSLTWSDEVDIAAYIKNDTDGPADAFVFVYTSDPDGEAIKHRYEVRLTYTEPNFGGVRPWFLCPDCGDRVGKLYLPLAGYRFACRSCHNLGYASSRQSGQPVFRAIQRFKNAFEKADAEGRRPHPNNSPYLPDRPKNMHRETYDELMAEVKARRDEFHEAMRAKMRDEVQRLQAD